MEAISSQEKGHLKKNKVTKKNTYWFAVYVHMWIIIKLWKEIKKERLNVLW